MNENVSKLCSWFNYSYTAIFFQLFLKDVNEDLSELADHIINQDYVGSVLKVKLFGEFYMSGLGNTLLAFIQNHYQLKALASDYSGVVSTFRSAVGWYIADTFLPS